MWHQGFFRNEIRHLAKKADLKGQLAVISVCLIDAEGKRPLLKQGAIGFGFASHWLKNWRDSFEPITKRSNRNHVITFDSHLKTALFKKKPINLQ